MADYEITDSTLPVADAPEPMTGHIHWAMQWLFPALSGGGVIVTPGTSIVVGRDPGCQVVTQVREVSRRHVELSLRDGSLVFKDLGSLNGTFVNGRRVAEAGLKLGDVLRVGELIGLVTRAASASELQAPVRAIADGFWAGPTLRSLLVPARKLAPTNLPVLLHGDTGSGKERVARAIHDWSGRSGAFVAVNCAAIPEGLAEAELFGYRKGAFTGAEQAAVGYFRAAHGGTLLLDEVADLPLAVQAKLLRVIEQSDVQPLGESRATPVDVRIVAASLTSLARRVEEGAFRGDLFARLNGVTITLPSLVQRKDEVCGLFFELMRQRNGGVLLAVEAPLLDRLLQYAWPGNVRELDLLIRRLLGLHGHEGKLRVAHLSGTALEEPVAATSEPPVADGFSRDAHDFRALVEGLRLHNGNLTKAAGHARISRQRAYRLAENRKFDLDSARKNGGLVSG